jgi:hypothetical protein
MSVYLPWYTDPTTGRRRQSKISHTNSGIVQLIPPVKLGKKARGVGTCPCAPVLPGAGLLRERKSRSGPAADTLKKGRMLSEAHPQT